MKNLNGNNSVADVQMEIQCISRKHRGSVSGQCTGRRGRGLRHGIDFHREKRSVFPPSLSIALFPHSVYVVDDVIDRWKTRQRVSRRGREWLIITSSSIKHRCTEFFRLLTFISTSLARRASAHKSHLTGEGLLHTSEGSTGGCLEDS